MRGLRDEGFFSGQKGTTEIVEGLKKKGYVYKSNQVSAALTTMFNAGEIQRIGKDNHFLYHYDLDR